MRILYIANHKAGGNRDESAIAYAFKMLGHKVIKVAEEFFKFPKTKQLDYDSYDFCLFHHWGNHDDLSTIPIPKAFWYFDLVDHNDPTLKTRTDYRKLWMKNTTDLVDVGFCTDGDWVNRDPSGKLVRLTQGCDERVLGVTPKHSGSQLLMMTASRMGTVKRRQEFIQQLLRKYHGRFLLSTKGLYREELKAKIAQAALMIAPIAPVSDNYWSNRVYNTCGMGGCLLHPYSEGLTKEYQNGEEIFFYEDFEQFQNLITELLADFPYRNRVAHAANLRTKANHTYRHRCETLINIMKERTGI